MFAYQPKQFSRFEELLTINTLSQAISSTLRLDDMFEIVREQVPAVTDAQELYLALYDKDTKNYSLSTGCIAWSTD